VLVVYLPIDIFNFRRFPTDGAITEVEWVRMRRPDTETHGPAMTRSIEFHYNFFLSTNVRPASNSEKGPDCVISRH